MSVFVSAEIGINHNGDIEICKKLIDLAADAGCNAVKFQKRNIDKVYTQEFLDSPRESPWGATQRDQKEGLELSYEQYKIIDEYCNLKNISWFASAWDLDSQEFLKKFDCKYNKIASAMIVYEDLLEIVASENKHTFISTGMSTMEDITKAVEIFKKHNCSFELMHTVSTYPMKDSDANLNLITTLKNKFKCEVGYSGHEVGLVISYAAVCLGISSLERHITLNRAMYGSDQSASLGPEGLRLLMNGVREIQSCYGDGKKVITSSEMPIANKLRAHLN
jgi:N-acetylneuraminate synthase